MSEMKVCIVGSTGHTGYVIGGIRADDRARLVGVAPGSEGEKVDGLADAVEPACEVYDDYRKMLDETEPDVTAVACHFGDHAGVAQEVLDRGIHLFVEKPVATTFEDLEKVRTAHKTSGVKLSAMFGIRYTPWFLTARRVVAEGTIGDIRLMTAQKSYRLGSRGVPYLERETYGGTIPWVGCHAIDWIQWFTDEDFKTVYASHSALHNRGHGDLEVSALCHFEFTGEVFGGVNLDYLRPSTAPTHGDDRLRVVGTEGVVEVRGESVYLIAEDEEGERELDLDEEEQIFCDFLKDIRGEGESMNSAEDAFTVTEAALKARQSADEGRLIQFDS